MIKNAFTVASILTIALGLVACSGANESDVTSSDALKSGGSSGSGSSGSGSSGGGSSSGAECTKADCGPEPLLASKICDDGSTAGPTCERNAKTNACGWIITTCPAPPPPPVCDKTTCGPEPLVASRMCKDGSVAGPVCELDELTDKCGWTITTCP